MSYLKQTQQTACAEKGGSSVQCTLRHCYNGPDDHLDRNPPVWTNLLRHELGRELCEEERDPENRVAIVVVCLRLTMSVPVTSPLGHTIGVQAKIVQKIVRDSLGQIPAINLEAEEHKALSWS